MLWRYKVALRHNPIFLLLDTRVSRASSLHNPIGSTVMHAVAQLVEALSYKQEGRGFVSRWCQWNFSLT
jgi:hypothetical protein